MKIAFTSQGKTWDSLIDPRFGRAKYLFFFDEEKNETFVVDNFDAASQEHGAGPKTAQKLGDNGANVLITGNGPGNNAAQILKTLNIKVYAAASGTLKQAYEKYKNGQLHFYEL